MLSSIITNFLAYCKTYNFGKRSIEVFSSRLKEFSTHLHSLNIRSIQETTYTHLLSFVSSGNPSVYTKKHRVWTLHQFFHYLKINTIIKKLLLLKYHTRKSLRKNRNSSLFHRSKKSSLTSFPLQHQTPVCATLSLSCSLSSWDCE